MGHESPSAADDPVPNPDGAIKNVTRGDVHDRLGTLLSRVGEHIPGVLTPLHGACLHS